jgi:hypothetical protein
METNEQLIHNLENEFAVAIPPAVSLDQMIAVIAVPVNELIQKDFQKLVNILYRLDVSEPKLRYMLKMHNEEDAGKIIATLIVERELQKIKTRQQFRKNDKEIDEDEKW